MSWIISHAISAVKSETPRAAQIRILGTEDVREVREGLGQCIELALSRVLGARLSVLQLLREGT